MKYRVLMTDWSGVGRAEKREKKPEEVLIIAFKEYVPFRDPTTSNTRVPLTKLLFSADLSQEARPPSQERFFNLTPSLEEASKMQSCKELAWKIH